MLEMQKITAVYNSTVSCEQFLYSTGTMYSYHRIVGPMHYRLSSIKGVPFRFANFASHFISVQIFQIDFPLILSAYKYFR